MEKGFVKIPRGCFGQKIFKEHKAFAFYVLLLYLVRFKGEMINGIYVSEGQLLTTKKELAGITGLSEGEVRFLLEKFEDYGCIKKENIKNHYTLITILPVFEDGAPLVKRNKTTQKEEGAPTGNKNVTNKPPIYERDLFREENNKLPFCEKEVYKKPENSSQAFRESISYPDKTLSQVLEKSCTEFMYDSFGKYDDTDEFFRKDERDAEEKKAYGRFGNIYLTSSQYEELKKMSSSYIYYIDKLSAYLESNPHKKYPNHFSLLYGNISDGERSKELQMIKSGKKEAEPDPTASYDIRRAEEMARTRGPVLKKRNRETGEWMVIKEFPIGKNREN